MTQPNWVEQSPAPAAPAAPVAPAAPGLLKSPDGKIYKVPAANVGKAITGGWQPLSPEEQERHRIEQEEEAKGFTGSLAAAGKSFVNQALFGVPGVIQEHTETPEQAKEREIRESVHPLARAIGGAGGLGASLLYGGEVFKGAELAGQAASKLVAPAERLAEAGLATRMAAKGVDLATQGAALAAPQAIVQAAFGDPKEAAETLLWGIGAGAILGGGTELAKSAAKGTAAAAASLLGKVAGEGGAPLEQFATDTTLKTLGGQKAQLGKLSPARRAAIADFAHEEGIITPEMSRAELPERVETARKKYGQAMDDAIKGLDGAFEKKPELVKEALTPQHFVQSLSEGLETPSLRMPMNSDVANAVDKIVESAKMIPTIEINGEKVLKFDDAQRFVSDLRSKYGNAIKRAQNEGGVKGLEAVTAMDHVRADAYQIASNILDSRANAFAVASDQPELVGALQKAKSGYAKVKDLEKLTANLQAQSAGNKMISLTDEIRMGGGGILGNALTGIGAAAGGFLAGPGGAVAGAGIGRTLGIPLEYMAKKWGEDRGMVILSSIAKRAAKDGPDVFSAVLASEGAKRVSQTMADVGDTIKRMAQVGITSTRSRNTDHMQHLLGGPGSTDGLSHEQQFTKLGDRLTDLQSNPQALAEATSALSSAFHATSPAVAEAYQQQMAQAVGYLHAALPKPPGPPPPFAPQSWSASPQDKLDFHDKAEILANPMAAMRHLTQGTLSDAHMDSLRQNYPTLLGKMQQAILDVHAQQPGLKLPAPERAIVGKLLGQPLEPLAQPQTMAALQANYRGQQGKPQQPSEAKPRKANLRNRPSSASAFESTMGSHLGAA